MEQNLDEKISKNIKEEIERSGMAKSEIAKAMGISAASLSQYCSGRTQPTLANLSRLCRIIGCSADEILELTKN